MRQGWRRRSIPPGVKVPLILRDFEKRAKARTLQNEVGKEPFNEFLEPFLSQHGI
jgi:hypothetical protein